LFEERACLLLRLGEATENEAAEFWDARNVDDYDEFIVREANFMALYNDASKQNRPIGWFASGIH